MQLDLSLLLAGGAAGCVNGLFGAGGGMLLVPLLSRCDSLQEDELFPASVAVILPLCLVTLFFSDWGSMTFSAALPYLLGSAVGGIMAGLLGKHIPTLWLHRLLGGLILWGGFRYLC